jgi:uncharacterized protein with NRDE domain
VCLLLVSFQMTTQLPLVVGANRDERYSRPARPVDLRRLSPRVLAGLDEEAGGTWLAVNEDGVVAGLTNQPAGAGRDRTKRTRGELPLLLAGHRSASSAVEAFANTIDPGAYNPCSILVGDRETCFSLELGEAPAVSVRPLGPGHYALENRPFGVATAKAQYNRARLEGVGDVGDDGDDEQIIAGVTAILADHHPPPELACGEEPAGRKATAACIHSDGYGTRSSMIILVPSGRSETPRVLAADGPPCTTPFEDVSRLWRGVEAAR